ncbi:MAG: hypothetical protein GY859_43110, partial [Desulfobacterales bacterium]|nr:hypothetical protein [Desulfobacterales bacterium]
MIKPMRYAILIGLFFPVVGTGADLFLAEQPLKETGIAFLLALSMPPLFFITVPAAILAFYFLRKSLPGIVGIIRNNQRLHLKPCIRFVVSLIIFNAFYLYAYMIFTSLGHGKYDEDILLKSVLSFAVIVVCPVVNLALYHYFNASAPGSVPRVVLGVGAAWAGLLIMVCSLLSQLHGPPLVFACRENHINLARTLIDLGFDVNKRSRRGVTAFECAVRRADPAALKMLVDNGAVPTDAAVSFGLQRAVESGRVEMLTFFLDKGVDPDSAYMGAAPLIHACYRKDARMVRLLLDHGARADLKAGYPRMWYDGKTPVDIAVDKQEIRIVEMLLTSRYRLRTGRSPDERDARLFAACSVGRPEEVRAALRNGANIDAADESGRTPLITACVLEKPKTVRLLLESGAAADYVDSAGRTALIVACERGSASIVKPLLDHGADAEFRGEKGWTALRFAVVNRHEEIVKLLLESRADINTRDMSGATPLMAVCEKGDREMAALLLGRGVDVNIKDNDGRAALMFALRG